MPASPEKLRCAAYLCEVNSELPASIALVLSATSEQDMLVPERKLMHDLFKLEWEPQTAGTARASFAKAGAVLEGTNGATT